MADNVIQIIVRARDEATQQFKQIEGATKSLAVSFGAIVAASASFATALGSAAVRGGREADDLRVLGVQAGLTAEQMSRLKFAANQLDTDIGAVASAFKFMNRNLFEARSGGQEALDSFRALGISVDDLKKGLGSTDAAFGQIIDRIRAIEDPGARAALTLKIFGRGAIEIAPLIAAGSVEMKRFGEVADATGATVSNAAGRIGDDFGDALDQVKDQFAGIRATLAESILPALTDVLKAVSEITASFAQFARQNPVLTKTLFEVASAIALIGTAAIALGAAIPLLNAGLAALGVTLGGLAAASGPIALAIIAFTALAFAINKANAEAQKKFEVNIVSNADEARAELDRLVAAHSAALDKVHAAEARLASIPPAQTVRFGVGGDPILRADPRLAQAQKDLTKAKAEVKGFEDAIGKAAQQLNAFEAAGKSAWKPITEGTDAASDGLKDFLADLEKAKSGLKDISGEDLRKALEPDLTLRGVQKQELKLEVDTTELDQLPLKIDEATKRAEIFRQVLEDMGVDVDELTFRLAQAGKALDEIVVVGESIGSAFAQAFDPLRVGLAGVQDAVGNFFQAFDRAGNVLVDKMLDGTLATLKFTNVLQGAIKTVIRLGAELALAVAKALILKSLGFASPVGIIVNSIGSAYSGGTVGAVSGGTVQRTVAHLASGGQIASMGARFNPVRLAEGGQTILRAAAGVFTVPGAVQARDKVPALLAPGEVVLPTIGGQRPADLLSALSSIPDAISRLLTERAVNAAPTIGKVEIRAFDYDSVRNQTRRGRLDRELARAAELGRA